ncbi:MAG: hypothetical protein JWR09_2805 [Mucilaginibacter sp.]|nr:hypothetical protein [Mucilaginibacter sp.]
MIIYNYLIYFFLLAGVALSIITRKLTVSAALLGGIVGLLVFEGGGYTGLVMLALFFILGSVATSTGLKKKQALGAADENKGRRTAGQVMANGGVAAILGAIAWYKPGLTPILQLMMAGSIAAATADTLSSELGTLLGSRFYNIITLKKDQPGLDGVVSIEGTLTGVAGAATIAGVYSIGHGWNNELLWIILAGIIGNLVDSILGAMAERKHLIGNNLVNFLNTLTGALVCLLLFLI